MASTRGKSKVHVLTVDTALPKPGQAASLALTVLRLAKTGTWPELADKVNDGQEAVVKALSGIYLTSDQLALLQEHSAVVSQVGHGAPRRTIALCDECGQHVTVARKSPPSRCVMTLLCEGTYTKVSPAKAVQVPAADVGASSDDADQEPQTALDDDDDDDADEPAEEADGGQGRGEDPQATGGQVNQDEEELGEDEEEFDFG